MATVFERPIPAQTDAQTASIPSRRRRRDSVEIIDVDELDDNIYQAHRAPEPGPSRPLQRRRLSVAPEIISLLEDSDDDDITIAEPHVRPATRTRLQSPPPRFPSWNHVPPVPPVPQRYAGQASLPMRRQAPSASPPVVRPRDQPFPFEANMHQQQPHRQLAPIPSAGPSNRLPQLHVPQMNNHEVLPPRPLQAAPPSHHIPSMGLGGALIAQNRPRHQHQHQQRSAGDHSLLSRVGSGVRRIFGGPASAPDGGPRNEINFLAFGNNFGFLDEHLDADVDPDHMLALQLLAEDAGEGLRDWDPAFNPARAYIRSEVLRRRNNAREESPYRKDYSHPSPPEPGFTYDFAPKSPVEVIDVTSPVIPSKPMPSFGPIIIDDDDTVLDVGPISGSNTPKSMAQFSSSQPRPQTPTKPVSTHALVCARCLEPLILGNNLTSEEQKCRRIWGLRCGHLIDGNCLKEIGQPRYTDQQPTAGTDAVYIVDRKGKGKAKVVDEDEDDGEYRDIQSPSYNNEPETNSIRSRLRPRHPGTSFANSSPSSSSAQTSIKRSAKSRSSATQLPSPQFIWQCPVAGCGRVHASIKVNGEWIPERDDGIYPDSSTTRSSSGRNGGRGRGRAGGASWRASSSARTGMFGMLNSGDENLSAGSAKGAIPLFL